MKEHNIFTLLLIASIICLVGTCATNIQQFAQYTQVREIIEEDKERQEQYEEIKVLYEIGLIDKEPQTPSKRTDNSGIYTPYNCLSIPVSIVFWTLAFFSALTLILSFSLSFNCSKSEKIRLYVLSSLSLTSTLIGVIYWAVCFHW